MSRIGCLNVDPGPRVSDVGSTFSTLRNRIRITKVNPELGTFNVGSRLNYSLYFSCPKVHPVVGISEAGSRKMLADVQYLSRNYVISYENSDEL